MTTPQPVYLTEDQLERLMERAVYRTLAGLGAAVDPDDPETIVELQADFHHMRAFRRAKESVQRTAWKTAIGTIVTGLLALLWLGIQSYLPQHH